MLLRGLSILSLIYFFMRNINYKARRGTIKNNHLINASKSSAHPDNQGVDLSEINVVGGAQKQTFKKRLLGVLINICFVRLLGSTHVKW